MNSARRLLALSGALWFAAWSGELASQEADSDATDSLLVEVRLAGVGAVLVIGQQRDGTLFLPAGPVYALAGLDEPPPGVLSITDLGGLLQVDVRWLPRQLVVELRDPFQELPATRARVDHLRAEAVSRGALALEARRTGPFGGVTVDDRRETMLDLGYSLGWAYGRIAHSSVSRTSWSVAANPLAPLWLTYSQREAAGARVGARVALRRTWISADYYGGDFEIAGASAVGPVVVFASSRDRFALTWRGDVDVQLGHAQERSSVRLSFGPIDPSPLSIPAVN